MNGGVDSLRRSLSGHCLSAAAAADSNVPRSHSASSFSIVADTIRRASAAFGIGRERDSGRGARSHSDRKFQSRRVLLLRARVARKLKLLF